MPVGQEAMGLDEGADLGDGAHNERGIGRINGGGIAGVEFPDTIVGKMNKTTLGEGMPGRRAVHLAL